LKEIVVDEAFPIFTGLLLGVCFVGNRVWARSWWTRSGLVVAAGLLAAVLSGEYQENWGFILVDIGEVALLAWIGFFLVVRLRLYFGKSSADLPARLQ
jgi:hypothetical protein